MNFSATVNLDGLAAQDPDVKKNADNFIKKLELQDKLSDQKSSREKTSADISYDELKQTVQRVAALVTGAQAAAAARKEAILTATHTVGETTDIKGAMDANTQVQLQQMLTINEMIGVLNGVLSSQQAENQRTLSNLSSTSKALTYD